MKKLMTVLLFLASAALFLPTQATSMPCSWFFSTCNGAAYCFDGLNSAGNCVLICNQGPFIDCTIIELTPAPEPDEDPVSNL